MTPRTPLATLPPVRCDVLHRPTSSPALAALLAYLQGFHFAVLVVKLISPG